MRYTIYFFTLLLCNAPFFLSSFYHDSAVHCAQKGQWADAYGQLNQLLIDEPDNAAILYDAGICAYNSKHYIQSGAYFSQAAECASTLDLKERALFNAGNAYVANVQLKEALDYYESALLLNDKNEYTRHNRDRVMQMLKEQEQQEQQKQNNQTNSSEDCNQNQKKSSKGDAQADHEQKDSSNNDENEADELPENKDKGLDQKNNDSDKNNMQKETGEGNQGNDQRAQEGQDQAKDSKNGQGNHKRNDNGTFDDDSSQENAHQANRNQNKHESSSKQSHDLNNSTGSFEKSKDDTGSAQLDDESNQMIDEQGQEGLLQALEEKINDPLLFRILQEQEEKDKMVSKKIMEAKIRHNGGKDGQNGW